MAKPARRTAHPRDWEEGVEFMRKYRYLAIAAAGVMVIGASAGTALAAPAKSSPVLRIGSTHGAAVKNGAKIGASLAKGQKVTMSIKGSLGTFVSTCPKSSFAGKVVKNPASKGKATLSITSETLTGKCSISTTLVTLKSITAVNLPFAATITSKGAVTISGTKASRPIGFSANLEFGKTPLTCVFTAATNKGTTSNKHNTVTFKNVGLTLNQTLSGSSYSTCSLAGKSATFSATYGPITDNSVKHHPKVFIG
jgi:hypothetical protein